MPRTRKQPARTWEAGSTPEDTGPAVVTRAPNAPQYLLPLEAAAARVQPRQAHAQAAERLWFCVYLPKLPLEAVPTPAGKAGGVRVLCEDRQGMQRVLLPSDQARAAGIVPGQSASAALALHADAVLIERSVQREQQTLESLAAWLERFSSCVSIVGPDVLVLEIAGSLRLFGGLRALRRQIAEGLQAKGFDANLAIAPTPLAATWIARFGRRACIREATNLMPVLRRLPLRCLDWPAKLCATLKGMGMETVGDCFRLPREGFVRRFGGHLLMELDRAAGHLPDPRTSWRAPERFSARHEMTAEQSDCELLLNVCESLLEQHEHFLLLRQQGAQQIRLAFFHLRAPATVLSVGCAEVERSARHWFELLKIRFEGFRLPEPVIAVSLEGGLPRPLNRDSAAFSFERRPMNGASYSMRQLAERLAARMGDDAVFRLGILADHRPERAGQLQTASSTRPAAKSGTPVACPAPRPHVLPPPRRPLWMLPEPERLRVREGQPWHKGRLQLLSGPERLETGWWDSGGISRDYYRARGPCGHQLWVFRMRERQQADDWYLQGYFG